jgi:hypothetical protein
MHWDVSRALHYVLIVEPRHMNVSVSLSSSLGISHRMQHVYVNILQVASLAIWLEGN